MRVAVVFVVACLYGCGGGSPSAPSGPSAPAPSRFTVAGSVTDRIDGSRIGGSMITLRGLSGTGAGMVATAPVSGGSYSLGELPGGDYEVTISGSSHVEHRNLRHMVSGPENNFSVLEWQSKRFGVTYDQQYDRFFRAFARNEGNPSTHRGVDKWDLKNNPPKELYISVTAPSQYDLNWDPVAANLFKDLLEEIVREQLSGMFCDRVLSLAVNSGPSVGIYKAGSSIIALRPDAEQVNDVHKTNGFIDGNVVSLYEPDYNNADYYRDSGKRAVLKARAAHELVHAFGAFHALTFDQGQYRNSIMSRFYQGNGGILTPVDRLALCLIGRDDTKPGNLSPDTNPN